MPIICSLFLGQARPILTNYPEIIKCLNLSYSTFNVFTLTLKLRKSRVNGVTDCWTWTCKRWRYCRWWVGIVFFSCFSLKSSWEEVRVTVLSFFVFIDCLWLKNSITLWEWYSICFVCCVRFYFVWLPLSSLWLEFQSLKNLSRYSLLRCLLLRWML